MATIFNALMEMIPDDNKEHASKEVKSLGIEKAIRKLSSSIRYSTAYFSRPADTQQVRFYPENRPNMPIEEGVCFFNHDRVRRLYERVRHLNPILTQSAGGMYGVEHHSIDIIYQLKSDPSASGCLSVTAGADGKIEIDERNLREEGYSEVIDAMAAELFDWKMP